MRLEGFTPPPGHMPVAVSMEVDPVTGELVKVTAMVAGPYVGGAGGGMAGRDVAVRARDPGYGFFSIEAEAAWMLRMYCGTSTAAMMLIFEAARRKRMDMGPLALTYATQAKLGLSRQEVRSALLILEDIQASLGWLRVIREGKRAAHIEATDLVLQNLWHVGKPKARRS